MNTKLKEKITEFEIAARPLIKYLCENHHPHVTVIVTPTRAELYEAQIATKEIDYYIVDE